MQDEIRRRHVTIKREIVRNVRNAMTITGSTQIDICRAVNAARSKRQEPFVEMTGWRFSRLLSQKHLKIPSEQDVGDIASALGMSPSELMPPHLFFLDATDDKVQGIRKLQDGSYHFHFTGVIAPDKLQSAMELLK